MSSHDICMEKPYTGCSQSPISTTGSNCGERPRKNPSSHIEKSGRTASLSQMYKAISGKYICTFQPSGPNLASPQICGQTFTRMADCRRHFKKHFPSLRIYSCTVPRCDKIGDQAYYRYDKLLEHKRTHHTCSP